MAQPTFSVDYAFVPFGDLNRTGSACHITRNRKECAGSWAMVNGEVSKSPTILPEPFCPEHHDLDLNHNDFKRFGDQFGQSENFDVLRLFLSLRSFPLEPINSRPNIREHPPFASHWPDADLADQTLHGQRHSKEARRSQNFGSASHGALDIRTAGRARTGNTAGLPLGNCEVLRTIRLERAPAGFIITRGSRQPGKS